MNYPSDIFIYWENTLNAIIITWNLWEESALSSLFNMFYFGWKSANNRDPFTRIRLLEMHPNLKWDAEFTSQWEAGARFSEATWFFLATRGIKTEQKALICVPESAYSRRLLRYVIVVPVRGNSVACRWLYLFLISGIYCVDGWWYWTMREQFQDFVCPGLCWVFTAVRGFFSRCSKGAFPPESVLLLGPRAPGAWAP